MRIWEYELYSNVIRTYELSMSSVLRYISMYLCGRAVDTGPRRRVRVNNLLFLQIFQCHIQMRSDYDFKTTLLEIRIIS